MRKVICMILMLALMLAGCGAGEEEQATAPQPTGTTAAGATAASTEAAVCLDSADYELVLEDNSFRNANGDVLIEVSYQKVVLLGDAPELQKINALIDADCAQFLSVNGESMFGTAEETEEVLHSMGMDYGDLFCTITSEVTHNAQGILSIRKHFSWFMGGVFNGENFGLTFDLRTGEQLRLEDLSTLPPAEFEQKLKETAAGWLRDTYGEGLFSPPEEVLDGYTLDEMMFYIENGQIILTFPTYTFTAGAAGSSVIPTGIQIG